MKLKILKVFQKIMKILVVRFFYRIITIIIQNYNTDYYDISSNDNHILIFIYINLYKINIYIIF